MVFIHKSHYDENSEAMVEIFLTLFPLIGYKQRLFQSLLIDCRTAKREC